jgi:hypothetical protein
LPLKNILIAVPSMGGVIKAKTVTSLVLLMRQLTRAGIAAEYMNVDAADIVYARNLFARVLLDSKQLDGLLFVDSDMQFRPALVMKMLRLESDFTAAAYPKRELDLTGFARAVASVEDFSSEEMARKLARILQYTVIPSWDSPKADKLPLKKGFALMSAAGMGCALISRAALQAMIDGGVVKQRKDVVGGKEQVGWGFFDNLTVGDVTLSEDFSFCWRWTRLLGRDLWVNVDEPIGHLGEFNYRSRYLDGLTLLPPAEAVPTRSEAAEADDEVLIDAPS